MTESANVKAFEAIEELRIELLRFSKRVDEGLTEIASETRRVIDWIEHDRPIYWKERVRRATDAVGEAKNDLHRCLMYPINDEQPSCTEERQAVKKAQAYLKYCQDKQDRLREWARSLRHEMHEYQGRVAHLRAAGDESAPAAAALLERVADTLEKYVAQASAAAPLIEAIRQPTPPKKD
ncbi:hypothetical protein Mal64_29690 [Pseudobythopirellula maris]|uniref:Uncharacterized protein n=1 Tax=Pseudobythopirellula maris TaxID=2527991 RepID=A0A5C5ZJQ8_9BACT|nr:hypothetical protein [Pseudobythopirellula maris]TWT87430.1 hypothetical protein Mal64_29690 [Pseudobythopirellula maris]